MKFVNVFRKLLSDTNTLINLQFDCLCFLQALPAGVSASNSQQVLARRIALRLMAIGDQVSTETGSVALTDLFASLSLNHVVNLTWLSVVRLYYHLYQLLDQLLRSDRQDIEESESFQTFKKLWSLVLRVVASWIADHGGWVSTTFN